MKSTYLLLFVLFNLALLGCNRSSPKQEEKAPPAPPPKEVQDQAAETPNEVVFPATSKEYLRPFYRIEHIQRFYDLNGVDSVALPPLEVPQDLAALSYEELYLLKHELLARNGYLFTDGFLRGYFNQFEWYKPIFYVPEFEAQLSETEKTLSDRIEEELARKKAASSNIQGRLQLASPDLMVNRQQFDRIPKIMQEDLAAQNFSILQTGRPLPFYVYDENAYQRIPNYITTDLYLFILQRYFSKYIGELEEKDLALQFGEILTTASDRIEELKEETLPAEVQSALQWAQTYLALAQHGLGEEGAQPAEAFAEVFQEESAMMDDNGGGPLFIPNPLVSYEELTPRGHYTKSESLKKYFKGFKWVALNGIDIREDQQLKGMLLLAYIVKTDQDLLGKFRQYTQTMQGLAGQEDNLSLSDLIDALPDVPLDELLQPKVLKSLRAKLVALKKEQIKTVYGPQFPADLRVPNHLYLISSTYSFSGEIFSRLVHVDMERSKRPFPKGLDLPAVFRDPTAESILLKEYKEADSWPAYTSRLKALQEQFDDFEQWDHNYGFKGVELALASSAEQDHYPDFMKTDAYNRKELASGLASWAGVKQALILYQEKPYAVEGGQGGGPDPPMMLSYVEPNLAFWSTAIDLVEWLQQLPQEKTRMSFVLKEIKELGMLLEAVATKQVEGQAVTVNEFNQLEYIGATIEHLLLDILSFNYAIPDREKSMALIADVYKYNQTNLNVAVGHANDIHVLVPINGQFYLARGAVYSYYEFTGDLMTDEKWRKRVEDAATPPPPEWLAPILRPGKALEGQLQFRYDDHW